MPLKDKDAGRDKPAADLLRRALASPPGAPGSDRGACPDPEILAAYVERALDADEAARYNLHFSQCARCREQLAAMVRSGEFAGAADVRRARPSVAGWNWDWRWLAPATAMVLFVAVVALFRPPHHPAEQTSRPLVAINQPTPAPAAPPADMIAKLGPAPAAAASAPSAPIVAPSRMRSAPIASSAKSEIAPPAKASQPSREDHTEVAANSTADAVVFGRLEMLKKAPAAPKAEGSGRSGIGHGFASGSGNGVGSGVGYAGGIVAPPPPARQTVTVESAVSPVAPAAPAPAARATYGDVSVEAVEPEDPRVPVPTQLTPPNISKGASAGKTSSAQDSARSEHVSAAVATNRNLTQNEMVVVEAGNATSARMLVHSPDPQVLWRFSGGRFVERSSDAGATWRVQWTDANAHILAGAAPSSDSCWLVGRAGLVLVTVNGKKWKQVAPPADADFVGVAATDASSAIVTSSDGRKFTTTDGGKRWTPAP
jgi:hypothetical protein